jgi:hypothetical protein
MTPGDRVFMDALSSDVKISISRGSSVSWLTSAFWRTRRGGIGFVLPEQGYGRPSVAI